MRNKYKHRVKTDEKEPSNLDKQPEIKEVKEFKTIERPEEQKPKEKAKTYPYSKYLGRNIKPKEEEKEEEKPVEEKKQSKYVYRRKEKEGEQPSETTISISNEEKPTLTIISKGDDLNE